MRSRTFCVGGQSKKESAKASHTRLTRSRTSCVGGQSKKGSAKASHTRLTRSRTLCVGGQSKKGSAKASHTGLTKSRTSCVGGQSKKESAKAYHTRLTRSRTSCGWTIKERVSEGPSQQINEIAHHLCIGNLKVATAMDLGSVCVQTSATLVIFLQNPHQGQYASIRSAIRVLFLPK